MFAIYVLVLDYFDMFCSVGLTLLFVEISPNMCYSIWLESQLSE